MNSFRENLRSELDFQGLTVKELSAWTGSIKGSLDNYLGARVSIPPAGIAVKIADAHPPDRRGITGCFVAVENWGQNRYCRPQDEKHNPAWQLLRNGATIKNVRHFGSNSLRILFKTSKDFVQIP